MKANENKLAEIQAKVKAPKGQFNSFGKYHYRSAEDILEAVKQIVNPMGFSITLSDDLISLDGRFYVKATATLTNGIETYSVSAFAREEESKKGMDGSQITGSSSSYSRKYALNGLFALDDTKDSDATNTHGKEQQEKFDASLLQKCESQEQLTSLYNKYKSVLNDADIQSFSNRKSQITK
jgi:hypothetical protein